MSRPDGGAAFPRPLGHNGQPTYSEVSTAQDGMSLRDWFAGQALNGCFASDRWIDGIDKNAAQLGVEFAAAIAVMAYKYADTMLAERAK